MWHLIPSSLSFSWSCPLCPRSRLFQWDATMKHGQSVLCNVGLTLAHMRYWWNRLLEMDASTVIQISSSTWVANRVGSYREVETWEWSEQSAMGRWLAPLKHPFLDGLPDLSGHCRFITLVWKDCGSFDVSTANGNWFVGQLLPRYVTSSHSYLCCSVWCSMCSRPSPPHTHAFGKVPMSLQEDKCSKVAWFLPNSTFNSQQDSSKVVWFFSEHSSLHRPDCIWSLLLSCHTMNQLVLTPARLW